MSALKWLAQMPAPKLAHSDGMVLVVLGERSVVFPSEAAARFFFEAFTELPALVAEVAVLRSEIDEGALHAANRKVAELEDKVAGLEREKADLEARYASEVERRTRATRRATVLAKALLGAAKESP